MATHSFVLTEEEALSLAGNSLDEIVNGEICTLPPPEDAHAALIEALYRQLSGQLSEDDYLVRITAYGMGIRRQPAIAVRNPDLSVFTISEWKTHFEKSGGRGYVWIAPRLVVECLSPSNRKGSIHQLLADYESAGTAEVWLINPREPWVQVYRSVENSLAFVSTISSGQLEASFARAVIDVDRLWHAFTHGS